MKKKSVLTIAGSDCSGGAGIQADLKTMSAFGVYGMSAITSLTAQNTTGVYGIMDCTPDMLAKQIDAVFTDIRPDAVKIGMVSGVDLIEMIADRLAFYEAQNVVLDPVMVSTSGSRLISEDAVSVLTGRLFPMATLVTPNIPEAQVLTGMSIDSVEHMKEASVKIADRYHAAAVLIKGGHQVHDANDHLYENGRSIFMEGRRIHNENTHGTGCTLSSAIASCLALGYSLEESVHIAKSYISAALEAGLDMGQGSGPLWHAVSVAELQM